MVVNEKALVRQMGEAYKNQGYTVAVKSGAMVITAGFWLVQIELDNVPNEVLSLIALHTRMVLRDGEAYKITKVKDGAIIQKRLIEDAMGGLKELLDHLAETEPMGPEMMKKTLLRFDGDSVWQSESQDIYIIDPRYEVMISRNEDVTKVGNGIYAAGNVSKIWILRRICPDAQMMKYLAGFRWVEM